MHISFLFCNFAADLLQYHIKKPQPEPDTKAVAAAIVFNATFDPMTIEQCDISFDYAISMAIAKRDAVAESIMNNNPVNFVHKYDAEGKITREDWK